MVVVLVAYSVLLSVKQKDKTKVESMVDMKAV